jgi:hypothetical protein
VTIGTRRRLPPRILAIAGIALALGAGAGAFLSIRSRLERSFAEPLEAGRSLQWAPLPVSHDTLERWGDGTVAGVMPTPTGLVTAGGSGLRSGRLDLSSGLPTLRVSALHAWRGRPVVALESGGLFRRAGDAWEEARSGYGTLHVRCLDESEGGELLVGAREGLFRAAWGAARLERLSPHPVRSLAAVSGAVLAGGEDGLFRVGAGTAERVETGDAWIESVGVADGQVFAATATGLVRGADGQALTSVAGGEDVAAGVVHDGAFWGTTAPPGPLVRRFEAARPAHAERLPAAVLRLVSSEGVLFADTPDGLFRRDAAGWRLAEARPPALPAGAAHVSALSFLGPRLVAGIFGGGLVVADGTGLAWREVPGSAAWGVNALLPAGGTMFVASLRGAARFDGARLVPLEGPGAAFSLAATRDGVAIGYGQGVLLPGASLVSAFHGLPGNQATALAAGESLFVGTPSGLGALDGRRVRWRATGNEGHLPHPWVQALLVTEEAHYVGTYGGGLARRARGRTLADGASLEPFPETEGLKTSAGALVAVEGHVFAGTEGHGLWRLRADGRRFEPVALPLPSPTVTALAARAGELWVGTDQGLARVPLAAVRAAP